MSTDDGRSGERGASAGLSGADGQANAGDADPIDVGWAAYDAGDEEAALRAWYFGADLRVPLSGDFLRELGLRADARAVEAAELVWPLVSLVGARKPRPQVVDAIADDLLRQVAELWVNYARLTYLEAPGYRDQLVFNEDLTQELLHRLWEACGERPHVYREAVGRTVPPWFGVGRRAHPGSYQTDEILQARLLEFLEELVAKVERGEEASAPAHEANAGRATRRIVSADGSADYVSIGDALAAASEGDEIVIRPGRYREALVVDRTVTIRGDGSRELIVLEPATVTRPVIRIEGGDPKLERLTIDGLAFWGVPAPPESGDGSAIAPSETADDGGAPDDEIDPESLEMIKGFGPTGTNGIEIAGFMTGGWIVDCAIHGSRLGIYAHDGASPLIEDNDITGCEWAGVGVEGDGTEPVIRANRIRTCWGAGIEVGGGASPRIEDNDLWGNDVEVDVAGSGSNPLIRANRLHDGKSFAVLVADGAAASIEDNEISGNGGSGVCAGYGAGAGTVIHGNRIRDGGSDGIAILDGSSPRIEDNDMCGNAEAGVRIYAALANPIITGNRIHSNGGAGIVVPAGASPTIANNRIEANAGGRFELKDGATPILGPNEIGQ